MAVEGEGLDHVQLIFLEFLGESGFEGCAEHLLRQGGFVVTRTRSKYRASLAPERVTYLSHSGTAGTLLPPRFLAASGHLRTSLCVMGARSQTSEVLLY